MAAAVARPYPRAFWTQRACRTETRTAGMGCCPEKPVAAGVQGLRWDWSPYLERHEQAGMEQNAAKHDMERHERELMARSGCRGAWSPPPTGGSRGLAEREPWLYERQ